MGKKTTEHSNQDLFDRYYVDIYGERWTKLRTALLVQRTPVEFSAGLVRPYFMDEASIIAARALPVRPHDAVLDMCAAPGGKTLVLATRLGQDGSLVANDRSASRRSRLHAVLDGYLPAEIRAKVTVTGHDSTRWSLHQRDMYDSILLDAPCSSERHVLTTPSALKEWSPSRPKRLSVQQFAMLAAALDAVKPEGYILYSTCALAPIENEQVIQKLLERRKGRCETVPLSFEAAENRDAGYIILPDTADGRGPLYFCLIRRTA
ncbi:RsmB/NOP family class I SAM-dependent RNA methyltransferase [Parasphaerochaeta coccoides]|uniref:NOL1/NOP2/Sun domain family member 4 n=1 Tax=Parasphaerochaeta coccoides (strain ATCC BAA-1237 / DSM 17374 / SPN1) TaxID=760011 RepID=F4GLJ8_PARC1|nr:RsmB/NOP family class I SAM-dependent RNA methyltransferase [Parasphaerochaeta coccoides]AEC01968.1 Fmu (Sun) domain protein [Parasphaerochaeta coccoides DSM 17374]